MSAFRSGLFAAFSGFFCAFVIYVALGNAHGNNLAEEAAHKGPVAVRECYNFPHRAVCECGPGMTAAGPSLSWDVEFPAPILMEMQNTVNYQLNGSDADAQWKRLVPSGGGIVRLGSDAAPFMVSTFHQLRCLDIIRKAYVRDAQAGRPNPTPLTSHCLNYIRQMILCRGNSRLERIVQPDTAHTVQLRDPQTCQDWRSLYAQAEANIAGF
jgi:Mycotoxin biosynthesis protein UstYa